MSPLMDSWGRGPLPARARLAAAALHRLLLERHWRDGALTGPDCGVRFNYRLGRFVKSYLHWLPWRDNLYYLQCQAYWTLVNWQLFSDTGEARYRELAESCSAEMLVRQRPDGGWDYPNREWSGRIATAEGTWASIGLLETARRNGDESCVQGALRWLRFVDERVGWQRVGSGLAVNYFAGEVGQPVPNNSAFMLRMLAEVADVTDDERHLRRCGPIVRFLLDAQRSGGELPYQLGARGTHLEHFQCAQYNAFQCLDLMRYHRLTGDQDVREVIVGVLRFLDGQVRSDGSIPYSCRASRPEVSYHLAAVAACLETAAREGLASSERAAERSYWRLLSLQRADGSFPHSTRDHRVLSDQRPYPRNLAMILLHLLALSGLVGDDPGGDVDGFAAAALLRADGSGRTSR